MTEVQMAEGPSLRVAYLVNHYPKVSHSFIRREILALERRGVRIERFSIRGANDTLVDTEDQSEQKKTRYVLAAGAWGLLVSVFFFALTRPLRFLRGLRETLGIARRSDRTLPFHLASLAEACRLLPWLEEAAIAHVHAHFGTNPAEVALLLRAIGGPSYSFTVHGPEEFDKPEFLGLKTKAAKAHFVVAISSFGRSQLFRWLDSSDWSKVVTVHCGLEPAFHAVEPSDPPIRPRFVSVGRLCEQKGQLVLLDACGVLRKAGVDFELVLAGDGEMRPQVESKIAEHDLGACVRITGWISGATVRSEILAARALVMPSFAEGLPVAIMESLALRRPVISTYVAGIPELIRPGREGWLVPAGDSEALAQAMQECLAASPESLTEMAASGHARVLARHDIDREAERLHSLFADAATRPAP